MLITLDPLPVGHRYEDRYGAWLNVFKHVAENEEVVVTGAPRSWCSLLHYLGADVLRTTMTRQFREDAFNEHISAEIARAEAQGRLRELVEMHSAARPELVDALYKSDMEWRTVGRRHTMQKEFNVTCNGSFYRPEVLAYLAWWRENMRRTKPKCVLVPCAADKPYPAPLHEAVAALLPPDYEMIVATGVLGLVPAWAWDKMPLYDSGLPNQWRLMEAVRLFFGALHYDKIVIYSDFYAEAIIEGLRATQNKEAWTWPLSYSGVGYMDLRAPENLAALKAAL